VGSVNRRGGGRSAGVDAPQAFDLIAKRAQAIALEPGFSKEVAKRQNHPIGVPSSDPLLLKELAKLIAYSQNAKANQITTMIAAGGLEAAFGDFDVSRVASADADHIRQMHWRKPNDKSAQLSVMRFKQKVDRIIGVAQAMQRLEKQGRGTRDLLSVFPKRIHATKDIEDFWSHFADLRAHFISARTPFFGQFTSLLHLLLHFGFDCVKPELVVMNVAKDYGFLAEDPTEDDLQVLVREIQDYSLSRNLRPAVVDLYLLVEGRQTGVLHLIKPSARSSAPLSPRRVRSKADALKKKRSRKPQSG
jgi:hypothetical protein